MNDQRDKGRPLFGDIICINNLLHKEFKTERFSRFTYTSIVDPYENEIRYKIKKRIDAFNEFDEPYEYLCNICGGEVIDPQTNRVCEIISVLKNNIFQRDNEEVFKIIEYYKNMIEYCMTKNSICRFDYDFSIDNVDTIIRLFSNYDILIKREWFSYLYHR